MRERDLIPNFNIIENCRLGNWQGRHSMEGPIYMGKSLTGGSWEGVKSIPRCTTYHETVDGRDTSVQGPLFCLRIIYNIPPSRPHQVDFYEMQGEWCLLLPRSSTGTLLLDLRSEARYSFCPFRELLLIWQGIREFQGDANHTVPLAIGMIVITCKHKFTTKYTWKLMWYYWSNMHSMYCSN